MNKTFKAINAFLKIIKKPYLLNLVLNDEKNWEKKVKHEFGFQSGLPLVKITNILTKDFKIEVLPYAFLDGSCTPLDLALIRGLAEKNSVKNYLEIGTWRGESVANVAPIANHCVTINLPDYVMKEYGMSEDYINTHRFFSEHLHNVTHIEHDSRDFDLKSLDKDFDLVFIDGDHHSKTIKSDTEKIFEIINPEKTIVVWHDYAYNPEKVRWSVLYGILSGCPRAYHQNIMHVSNTLCAIYLPDKNKFCTAKQKLKPYSKPELYFKVTIEPLNKKKTYKNHTN